MKKKRIWRLPDNTNTNCADEYIDAWRKLAEPVEEMTGLKHIAFDPGVQFSSGDHLITLPTWFIELLNKYYETEIALDMFPVIT